MRTRVVALEGTHVVVRESDGRGATVLMIHGNSTSSLAFRHQLEGPLGTEFRIVALDLPGHGGSDWARDPSRAYSLPAFAEVVAAVARELEISDHVVLGWSLGGHIVLEATALLPSAAGFCVFGTPPLRFPPNFEQAFLPHPVGGCLFTEHLTDDELRAWAASNFSDGVLRQDLLEEMRRADPRVRPSLAASVASPGYLDETQVLARLDRPIAFLHGVHDVLVNRDYIASLRIPSLWRGRIHDIDAGHAPQWERPDQFDALLRDFTLDVS